MATVPYLPDLCSFAGDLFIYFLSDYFAFEMFNLSVSADPFETMLKSLLRYQSDSGNVSENLMRKKLYENGVTDSLRSNFALLLKVR